MVPIGHVSFPGTSAPRLEIEIMLSEERQARGLMFRKSLRDDQGIVDEGPAV